MPTDRPCRKFLRTQIKIVLVTLLVLLLTELPAQYKAETFRVALLETGYGAMIVFNGQANSFSLKVEGKSVRPMNQPNFMTADSLLFQSTTVPFQEEKNFTTITAEEKKDLLLAYRLYEKEYVEETLHTRLRETVELIELNGQPFLYWSFMMPQENTSVGRQVYLITICFDQVVVLNAPVPQGKDEAPVKDLFLRIGKTLEVNAGKTCDVDSLYYALRPASLAPPFRLPIPDGWTTEISAFPTGFAPKIPFKGEAHLRFSPGWREPDNKSLWTYAMLWWVNPDAAMSQPALERYLWEYYNGLVSENMVSRNIDPAVIVPTVVNVKEQKNAKGDMMIYTGTVKMLDYFNLKPVTLNIAAHALPCNQEKKLGLLFLISPQPGTHPVWKTLNSIREDFQCSDNK